MRKEEKKAFLLLKSVIFHYHGLNDDEKNILKNTALEIDGIKELDWAFQFIEVDLNSAFERARVYFGEVLGKLPKEKRLNYLDLVWKATNYKGYITEMEATAMLKLAKEWEVENDLMTLVRS
jgi:hypothetical protein